MASTLKLLNYRGINMFVFLLYFSSEITTVPLELEKPSQCMSFVFADSYCFSLSRSCLNSFFVATDCLLVIMLFILVILIAFSSSSLLSTNDLVSLDFMLLMSSLDC